MLILYNVCSVSKNIILTSTIAKSAFDNINHGIVDNSYNTMNTIPSVHYFKI